MVEFEGFRNDFCDRYCEDCLVRKPEVMANPCRTFPAALKADAPSALKPYQYKDSDL